jgi:hypothetical protein
MQLFELKEKPRVGGAIGSRIMGFLDCRIAAARAVSYGAMVD